MITFLSRTGLMNEGFFISRINLSLEPLESPSIIPFVLVEINLFWFWLSSEKLEIKG